MTTTTRAPRFAIFSLSMCAATIVATEARATAQGLSFFASPESVRAGAHFPTDVVASSIVGAGVGVVVPHLHRSEDIKQRRVRVGFSPAERGSGGSASVTGIF